MKTILFMLVMSWSFSSVACSCLRANFDRNDVQEVLNGFVQDKLEINSSDIVEMKLLGAEDFLRPAQKAFLWASKKLQDKSSWECDLMCSYESNTRYNYQLTYNRGSKTCTRDISVRMMSDYLDMHSFSSKVKSKSFICN